MARLARHSTLFCTICGAQGLWVSEGDDYYQGSSTYCTACNARGCNEDFLEWDKETEEEKEFF